MLLRLASTTISNCEGSSDEAEARIGDVQRRLVLTTFLTSFCGVDFSRCLARSLYHLKYSDILTGNLKCKFLYISALVLWNNLYDKNTKIRLIYCFSLVITPIVSRRSKWNCETNTYLKHKTMEEIKYEYKEREIGHSGDGEALYGTQWVCDRCEWIRPAKQTASLFRGIVVSLSQKGIILFWNECLFW